MQGETVSHYRIEQHIGSGAMGSVYRATDLRSGARVAVKFMQADPGGLEFAEAEARFQREAQILHRLRHEHIVALLDSGCHGALPFIVMEYVDAPSLKELMRLGRSFSLDDIGNLGFQALSGLGLCHGKGIVHRDIKPSNILVRPGDKVLLVDFGIARADAQVGVTQTGAALGTPAYMSPEQTEGKAVTPASDVWSMGVVLYELLTGELPFGGDNSLAMMNNIRHTPHPDPSFYRPELAGPVDSLLRLALAKEPWARFPARGGGGSPALEFQKALLVAIEAAQNPGSLAWQQHLPSLTAPVAGGGSSSGAGAAGYSAPAALPGPTLAAGPRVTPAQQRQLDTLKRLMLQAKANSERTQLLLTQYTPPVSTTRRENSDMLRNSVALALCTAAILFLVLITASVGNDNLLTVGSAVVLIIVALVGFGPWLLAHRSELKASRRHASEIGSLQTAAAAARAEFYAAQTAYERECQQLGVKP